MKNSLENTVNRRNALKGMMGLAGGLASLALPSIGYSREYYPQVDYINNRASVGGLYIETDGKAAIYRNDGEFRESFKTLGIPVVSLGTSKNNYKITFGAPAGRKISVTFPKKNGRNYGGIDTKDWALKIESFDRSCVVIQDRRKGVVPIITEPYIKDNPERALVPLISTTGFFHIDAGDLNSDGFCSIRHDEPGIAYSDIGKMKILTPTFQLNPHDLEGMIVSGNEIYFVDYFGKVFRTSYGLIGIADPKNRNRTAKIAVSFYVERENASEELEENSEGRIDKLNLYFPTIDFACFREKERFWNLDEETQSRLGDASLEEFKIYDGILDENEKRIIQEHWRNIGIRKRQMERGHYRSPGQRTIVDPDGALWGNEDILRNYYKRKR